MRRLAWGVWPVVALGLLLGACQRAGSLSDQDKAAIQKNYDDFARMVTAAKPDTAALVAMYYAADATVMPPDVPAAVGRDAIIAGFTAAGGAKTFKYGALTIVGGGDTAFVDASYELTAAAPATGELIAEKGKSLAVWKKQPDGSWKAIREIWNTDAPRRGLFLPTTAIKADAGPELKALEWMAGRWAVEGESKVASPFGPPGKSATVMDCRWFAGGLHLFCAVDGTMVGSVYHELTVYTYDAEAKTYRGFDIDNTGMATEFGVSLGKTEWAFNYDLKAGGKPVRLRLTLFDMTADAFKAKWEMSGGRGPLTVIDEAAGKRLK